MTPDAIAIAAMIILLFPMGYFTLASPAFLLVKLDIRPVALLLRGMFNVHFLVMGVAGIIGTAAFLLAGRLLFAAVVGLLAAVAIGGRRRFMQRMDDQLSASDAGDTEAPRRLRRLHWSGMLCNAVLLAALLASIPYIATSA
ncbi:hypothetical protein XI09_31605 [Bradyrhizobium sp. CCBAU 11386]|uniref:hypothetical protein n=1 Tax=Bradyrhizobium sp. CCBAU 11386 TaxID=1630837 RepID=UPI0023032E40|nr:hypothetical protein [Bradyrhizobium sp. CCBAU 11386]MDA9509107.1 hypothetical protein [Bradyrhizobium sp. CCBAU 11386]